MAAEIEEFQNKIECHTPKIIDKEESIEVNATGNSIGEILKGSNNENLADKYIEFENKINEKIFKLLNNNDFISLLEKYDILNEESINLLNDELARDERQKGNYIFLVEIKENYNKLFLLFKELNKNELNKTNLLDRINQNDKKLIDSSTLNNELISYDNKGGVFKSNDYLKLLLLDLRIFKNGSTLKNNILLEKDLIIDMLNRYRVHFFSLRMNELLKRHIEDVNLLNKKDEDSFYLENVLRKKLNLIHIENTQLKEQINRVTFLIDLKDQEINKMSITLFSLQDQLDYSINEIRNKLKTKYGTFRVHENKSLNEINETYNNFDQLKELKEANESVYAEKEVDLMNHFNSNNNSLIQAHFKRHNYFDNPHQGARLRTNQYQLEADKETANPSKEEIFDRTKNSIPSNLNIFSQCKHVRSISSTPRNPESSDSNARVGSLVITPINTDHEFIERVESSEATGSFDEGKFNIRGEMKGSVYTQVIENHQSTPSLESEKNCVPSKVNDNNIGDTDEISCNNDNDISKTNNIFDLKTNVADDELGDQNNKRVDSEHTFKVQNRQNFSLQNYKQTEKRVNKLSTEHKNIQENERVNVNIQRKGNTETKMSKNNSRELIKPTSDQLESYAKPTVTSLSKKRTKSKERLIESYGNSSFNFMKTDSKTSLTHISSLKGGIFDDYYNHNESVESASILSKRNLRKSSNDSSTLISRTKDTNLIHNSSFNISNSALIDKYYNNKINSKEKDSNRRSHDSKSTPLGAEVPVVKAYKATIQSIKSINDFQLGELNNDPKSQEVRETKSFLLYSPEIKPLELQPTSYVGTNPASSRDISLSRSNTSPLLSTSLRNGSYSLNLLNNTSSSSGYNGNNNYFGQLNTSHRSPSNANSSNIQYVAPIPTPITFDAIQQRILFPNGFHSLYK
ncbi:hypothetical protein HWI79_1383 [Cryptosporidium felis]|nr:hypothetical protein HWI79_1383 [Cryptosporidium felis]